MSPDLEAGHMPDDIFLGETLPPKPAWLDPALAERCICCLCSDEITDGPIVEQRFEADPTGRLFSAHAKCAHEYGLAMRAFRGAAHL